MVRQSKSFRRKESCVRFLKIGDCLGERYIHTHMHTEREINETRVLIDLMNACVGDMKLCFSLLQLGLCPMN